MLKWWLLAGFFGLCLGAAGLVSYRARQWVAYYTALVNFCGTVQTKIGFTHQNVERIITDFLPVAGALHPTLVAYQKLLTAGADVTREQCAGLATDPDVAEFFYALGRLGAAEERQKLTAATAGFQSKQTAAEQHYRTRASIAAKLLIIMGCAGVILWI